MIAQLQNSWQSIVRVHPSITDVERQQQSKWLGGLISILTLVSFLVLLFLRLPQAVLGSREFEDVFMGAGLPVLFGVFVYWLNRRGNYLASAYIVVGVLFFATHTVIFDTSTVMFEYYVILTILLSGILMSWKTSIVIALLSTAIQIGFVPLETQVVVEQNNLVSFTLTSSIFIVGVFLYRIDLERKQRADIIEANEKLRESEALLEKRVAARTRDLEVAAQVSTQITTVLDHHQLLPQIVDLTKTSFNLYQVSIYLFDNEENILKYEAGTGEAGRAMIERGKQFLLDEQGLVPRSAVTRVPQRVGDVRQNPNYYPEATLPDTRSELAVPMIVGENLIGVLDLQSVEVDYFSEDDLVVMSQLAKQVAIAVQNAQLYAYQLEVAEELRAVDELKSQFLASMSHELRTPLNAILNFSKFINMGIYGEVTEKQVDAMGKIIGSAQHLLSLINDVLDVTKIESGMMQLFVEDNIDLYKEIDPVVTTAETLLSENDEVVLIKDIDETLPSVVGDKRRIRQILLNLVSNACKFTETGSVTISIKHKDDKILCAVLDTGPGIPEDKLGIIFEPFQQTETGVKHAGGTGLGLPISKKLAEAHGGKLWADTTSGNGSAFYVELPVRSAKLLAQLENDTVNQSLVEA